MQVNSPSKLRLRLHRAITYRTVDSGGAVQRGGHLCADGGGEGARGREMLERSIQKIPLRMIRGSFQRPPRARCVRSILVPVLC